MSDRVLADLIPALQTIYSQWEANCVAAGLNAKAIVTWRSSDDQNAAKEQGLSNAAAGQSPHNNVDDNGNPASLAFDFGIFNPDGSYVEDGTDDRYKQAAEIGKNLGLAWGGDWHHPDYDHLEMVDWQDKVDSSAA